MSSRLRAYTVLVVVGAVVLAVWLVPRFTIAAWFPLAALVFLNVLTENFAFTLPAAGSVSLSFAVTYAALLYSGPVGGMLCAVAGSYTVAEYRARKPLTISLFNAGQLAIAAGLSGYTYVALGGPALSELSAWRTGEWQLAAAVAAAAFFFVNMTLVGVGLSLMTSRKFAAVVREQGFLSYAASHVVLGLLGVMIAGLLTLNSWLGLVLLVLPFMAARRTFRVYAELTEAYTSTVRSLVAAIEAKDPYTRGHSERVAVYARRLGEASDLKRSEADLLEHAALLHDVGKIGIEADTLGSPAQLNAEEVRAIRQHPIIGSELVEDVEFLADIVPIVRHHHERYDGAGYPDGLVGDQIPVLARVLAVADAYDAMTSDRAYRPGMTQEQALVEIVRVAGTQLDRELALRFTSLVAADQTEMT
ncbi:MAG: HD-GYP domain-containing protein [Actinobacteria bacterium]|nr:HD-GYP domain-containing protein [Actinomycetota bacterium]